MANRALPRFQYHCFKHALGIHHCELVCDLCNTAIVKICLRFLQQHHLTLRLWLHHLSTACGIKHLPLPAYNFDLGVRAYAVCRNQCHAFAVSSLSCCTSTLLISHHGQYSKIVLSFSAKNSYCAHDRRYILDRLDVITIFDSCDYVCRYQQSLYVSDQNIFQ